MYTYNIRGAQYASRWPGGGHVRAYVLKRERERENRRGREMNKEI